MLEPSPWGIIFQKYSDQDQTSSDRSGQDEPKFSNFGPEYGGLDQEQQNSEQPIGFGGPWISWSDTDLIGPKMNIQDAIKIKLLRWENEFERVEHF